jgi:hypothetical protein
VAFASSFLFFGLTYYISRFIMTSCPKIFPTFSTLKKESKRDYLSRVASTIHALLSCVASVISAYYLCGLGDECMMQPQLFRSQALAFSAGYFAYDLSVCMFLLKADKMTLTHHLISLSGSVGSVYVG